MAQSRAYPLQIKVRIHVDTSKKRIEGAKIAQRHIGLGFPRVDTGSIDHLRDALRVDTSVGPAADCG